MINAMLLADPFHGLELKVFQVDVLGLSVFSELAIVLLEFLARTPFLAGDKGPLLDFVPSVLFLECVQRVLGLHACVSQRNWVHIILLRFSTKVISGVPDFFLLLPSLFGRH